jgi:hypothetical protein
MQTFHRAMMLMGRRMDIPRTRLLNGPTRLVWGMLLLVCSGLISLSEAWGDNPLLEEYTADRNSLQYRYPDIRVPGVIDRFATFYQSQQEAMEKIDFQSLGRSEQVDYLMLQSQLRFELTQLGDLRQRDADGLAFLPELSAIRGLLREHERSHTLDGRVAAEAMESCAKSCRDRLEAMKEAKPSEDTRTRLSALWAADQLGALRRSMLEMHQFHVDYDPMYTWWASKPYEALDAALYEVDRQTREKVVGVPESDRDTIIGQPIGAALLRDALDHAWIPYTPEELIAIGERELAWCDEALVKATRGLGAGDDWRRGLELVNQRYVEPGKQPELIHDLAQQSIDFLEQRDLITIPPLAKEDWRMEMMSPERQRMNPYFLGGDSIIVAYPTVSMTHAEKLTSLRGNNPHFARATVHHELIPGHHLQYFMMARHRVDRRAFETPFWIEGWALYWELKLWDLGFARDDYDRIGMLFWRRHRAARIVFSLKYQLGQFTPEDCVRMLVERAGHEPGNAKAEVRRSVMGGYGPLYQAAYLLGGLQLRALHEALVGSGAMTERAFHDAVLQRGPIPIELLRLELTPSIPIEKTMRTQWRFPAN